MAAVITANDVTHGFSTTVPHDEIELLIEVVSAADDCLDANSVPESKQKILKIYAVRHMLTMQANSGAGIVKSRTAPSGASQSFATWQGQGVQGTSYGALLKQLDVYGCVVSILENDTNKVGIYSVGGRC